MSAKKGAVSSEELSTVFWLFIISSQIPEGTEYTMTSGLKMTQPALEWKPQEDRALISLININYSLSNVWST